MARSSAKYARWLKKCENLLSRELGVKVTRPNKRNQKRLLLELDDKSFKMTVPSTPSDINSWKNVRKNFLSALEELGIHHNLQLPLMKMRKPSDEAEADRIFAEMEERENKIKKALTEILFTDDFLEIAFSYTASGDFTDGDITLALLWAQREDHQFAERTDEMTEEQATEVIQELLMVLADED